MRTLLRSFPVLVLALAALPAAAAPTDGWIGILLGETRVAAQDPDDPRPAAVRVAGVFEESPADRAGLRAKDWILAVDGAPVANPSDLVDRVRGLGEDAWVQVTVERDGRERVLSLRLGPRPETGVPRSKLLRGWIGVRTLDLTPGLRRHFGAPEEAGVMIAELVAGGPADLAGFELGDVVYGLDGSPVRSSGELAGLVAGSGIGNRVEFEVARSGARLVLEGRIERAPERGERDR